MRNHYVAILCDDVTTIHATDMSGNYATLCGMDGDDPDDAVDQRYVDVPCRAKINCQQCKNIVEHARKYTKRDFEI